jgi:hypothetical protein
LARAAGDDVYTIRKLAPGKSEMRELEITPSFAQFLGELSLSGYQELGYDTVFLVEGPKEVKVMQRLLRRYSADHRVVLLPLGGASMINASAEAELAEVTRLSSNVFTLIDSERSKAREPLANDRKTFLDICRKLGIRAAALQRRAIENYMTDRAVKAIMGEKYRALEPYERRQDVNPVWAKGETWRIAGELTRQELEASDLGKFVKRVAQKPASSSRAASQKRAGRRSSRTR